MAGRKFNRAESVQRVWSAMQIYANEESCESGRFPFVFCCLFPPAMPISWGEGGKGGSGGRGGRRATGNPDSTSSALESQIS